MFCKDTVSCKAVMQRDLSLQKLIRRRKTDLVSQITRMFDKELHNEYIFCS